MSSQFVDINGDGSMDILTATFDGTPHVAYGSVQGLRKPVHLKDRNGERILLSSIWDYEKEEHIDLGRAMPDGKEESSRCTSALAYDWDQDGDYDLLLGSYDTGKLYRQMNEGTNAKPAFTGKNIEVMLSDEPFKVPGKLTAPRLVDWDGDGDLDILAGTYGGYAHMDGGGVYLALDQGKKGKPDFRGLMTLIAPSPKGQSTPTRPDTGLYPDAVDYDQDGDLDLIVGGYSNWKPKARVLNAEEKARLAELEAAFEAARKNYGVVIREMQDEMAAAIKAAEGDESKTPAEIEHAIVESYSEKLIAASDPMTTISKQMSKLKPGEKQESFVWIYERLQ